MTPQGWESPETFAAPGGGPGYGSSEQTAAYALRPLSLGEVLDRTFTVYRSRFWLFAGIGAVAALLQTVISAAQLVPFHMAGAAGAFQKTRPPMGVAGNPFAANHLLGMGVGASLALAAVSLLYLLVVVVTQAATVFALSEVYLGKTTTIGESVRATIGRWYRYLGAGIWQAGSMLWVPAVTAMVGGILIATKISGLTILGWGIVFVALLGGIPVGFILWLRNSLAVQATVIEGLRVRASMARSKVLTVGAKGRVFVLLLLAGALSYAASLLQMPLMLFVMFTIARGGKAVVTEIVMLLVGFVGHALVQPVLMIGLSLLYFDQRVRKEAFDLVMLLGPPSGGLTPGVAATWVPAQSVRTDDETPS